MDDKNKMQCRVCSSNSLRLAIDLGNQQWANNFLTANLVGKELSYPLRVVWCEDCHTAQLDYTVAKEVMFSDHTYCSGVTRTLSHHFNDLAKEVTNRFFRNKANKTVFDIGSNDGTALKSYQMLGYDVLGVESSVRIAEIANASGVPTINKFFNLEVAKEINRKFDVINASGVFFHLEELHSVTEGIKFLLDKNGVFVVQFIYMKSIIDNMAFDQIYHEHLLYYTLRTIDVLLKKHGLSMFDAYLSPIHGGSIIGFVTHIGDKGKKRRSARLMKMLAEEDASKINEFETYEKFALRIQEKKKEVIAYLEEAKLNHKVVFGMGAPVKGNTLLNTFGINSQYIQCLVEKNPMRDGLFAPGSHLPIVLEKDVKQQPDIYFVLAWNFKKEILENNKELIEKGVRFYFPVNPKEV